MLAVHGPIPLSTFYLSISYVCISAKKTHLLPHQRKLLILPPQSRPGLLILATCMFYSAISSRAMSTSLSRVAGERGRRGGLRASRHRVSMRSHELPRW